MTTQPNIRTLQMQDTIDRLVEERNALRIEVERLRKELDSTRDMVAAVRASVRVASEPDDFDIPDDPSWG